ncbi:hypothetical protein M422DRAFT_176226, partial [Sphaerobolus stellatus SS14]
ASKSSKNSPCTNHPLECELCSVNPVSKRRPIFWKYNFQQHLTTVHPGEKGSEAFQAKLVISSEEIDHIIRNNGEAFSVSTRRKGDAEKGEGTRKRAKK